MLTLGSHGKVGVWDGVELALPRGLPLHMETGNPIVHLTMTQATATIAH